MPGVVSVLEAAEQNRVFEQKGKDAKMIFMSSGESDNSLGATLQDNGLVWEVLPGGTGLARAYKPVVDRTIAYLQGKGTLSGASRIALVSAPDISLLADMGNALQSAPSDGGITFNEGKSVLDNIRDNTFYGTTTSRSLAGIGPGSRPRWSPTRTRTCRRRSMSCSLSSRTSLSARERASS